MGPLTDRNWEGREYQPCNSVRGPSPWVSLHRTLFSSNGFVVKGTLCLVEMCGNVFRWNIRSGICFKIIGGRVGGTEDKAWL